MTLEILKEIQWKLMQIDICVDELKQKIFEKDEELEELKEQIDIKENAERSETPER